MPMKECVNIFVHHQAEKWWSQDPLKLENLVLPIKRGDRRERVRTVCLNGIGVRTGC